ncbi:MAG: transcription initiation factor IIE [Clostridiales bacterium]|nr:transcription initiation factor IIE [Clostridiales bacterium]
MKFKEEYLGTKQECMGYLSEAYAKLLRNQLMVDGEEVVIPDDKEMEYKIKYDNDEFEGSLSLKITWVNAEAEEAEEEEEVEGEEE